MTAPRRNRRRTAPEGSVAAYIRVSTDEQAKSGLGLEDQRAKIQAEADARGWTITAWFVDEGVSASKDADERPAARAALEAVKNGEAATLLFLKIDRMFRSVYDLSKIMRESEREGWTLTAVDGTVDTTTSAGRLQTHIMGSFAEYERNLIGERTKAALAAKKARGERLGRPQTLPDAVVRRVMDERAGGRTLQAIADGLKADGIPTAQGGTWAPSNVRAVLKSQRAADLAKGVDAVK